MDVGERRQERRHESDHRLGDAALEAGRRELNIRGKLGRHRVEVVEVDRRKHVACDCVQSAHLTKPIRGPTVARSAARGAGGAHRSGRIQSCAAAQMRLDPDERYVAQALASRRSPGARKAIPVLRSLTRACGRWRPSGTGRRSAESGHVLRRQCDRQPRAARAIGFRRKRSRRCSGADARDWANPIVRHRADRARFGRALGRHCSRELSGGSGTNAIVRRGAPSALWESSVAAACHGMGAEQDSRDVRSSASSAGHGTLLD